jgi:hypothetical protein
MVVAARISYVRALFLHGANVTCSYSSTAQTGTENIETIVRPDVWIEPCFQTTTLAMLLFLSEAAERLHSADRGHRHSGGASEICFYISRGRAAHSTVLEGFSPDGKNTMMHSFISGGIGRVGCHPSSADNLRRVRNV